MATTKTILKAIRAKTQHLGETPHAKRKRLLGKHYRKIEEARRSKRAAALAAVAAFFSGTGDESGKAKNVSRQGNTT